MRVRCDLEPERHAEDLAPAEPLPNRLGRIAVEDPEVLVEPWVMAPRTLRLNPNPDAGLLPERAYCEVFELEDIASQIRH